MAKFDWEAIEKDFRAGMLSIREIAKIHGCSEGAVRKKMKKGGITRDLSKRVAEKVRTDLVRNAVRTGDPKTEKEIIEQAAATTIEVVRSHRKKINKGKIAVETLLDQLMEFAKNREVIEDAIAEESKEDNNLQRKTMMLKAVKLPSHASIAVNLSNALKNFISLERQAYNMDNGSSYDQERVEGFRIVGVIPGELNDD